MKYLVDANVLSEPTRTTPTSWVEEWPRRNEREIAVDPIILGEVRFGILLLRRGRKRAALERWFRQWDSAAAVPAVGGGDRVAVG